MFELAGEDKKRRQRLQMLRSLQIAGQRQQSLSQMSHSQAGTWAPGSEPRTPPRTSLHRDLMRKSQTGRYLALHSPRGHNMMKQTDDVWVVYSLKYQCRCLCSSITFGRILQEAADVSIWQCQCIVTVQTKLWSSSASHSGRVGRYAF